MDKTDVTQCKVAVLAGGWSDEREISLDSGRACAKALGQAGFEGVELLDVAADDFLQRLTSGGFDVAFVAMHGRYGEDGCVQGLLEVLHMPYTFSGVLTSAVATEKDYAKSQFRSAGIPTAKGTKLSAGHVPDEADDYFFAEDVTLEIIDQSRDLINPAEALHVLERHGFLPTEAQLKRLLELIMNLTNAVPKWTNNGWAPTELETAIGGR